MRGADMSKRPGKPMQAAQLVAESLKHLRESPLVIPGLLNRVGTKVGKHFMG